MPFPNQAEDLKDLQGELSCGGDDQSTKAIGEGPPFSIEFFEDGDDEGEGFARSYLIVGVCVCVCETVG